MIFFQILFLFLGFFETESRSKLRSRTITKIAEAPKTWHEEVPYQVRIFTINDYKEPPSQEVCGGTILDDYHIVSAAHCFVEVNDPPYAWKLGSVYVVAGATDFKRENPHNWVISNVKKITVPSLYWRSLHNGIVFPEGDIAVLKLEEPLYFRENSFKAVKIPSGARSYEYKSGVVSGYGYHSAFAEKSKFYPYKPITVGTSDGKLRFAFTEILSNTECQSKWFGYNITEKHICAQITKTYDYSPKGICSGDSGGPLIYDDYWLIGVINQGPVGCMEDVLPHVFTRVSAFKDFINKACLNKYDRNDQEVITRFPPLGDWHNIEFNFFDD